ncbi:hypothetical protein FOQG_18446 [Fusarium oxysporum f. sp. raphani 54005]|uniref:Uncharacterized protein n=2 Tax=Fusarium oxysporum f. sp. raphani TaxID=96318 RepID=X0C200_FUSOX|nr:hypothetical protein FOQG_18446 [Fusarium oxysporum f. sp. raphani 54005]KAG7420651.1 hypothetical protein Forpi1262_v016301 [Fusarium oxysporum f. sp. raphani]
MPSPEQSDPKVDKHTKSSVEKFNRVGYFFEQIAEIGDKVAKLYQEGRAGQVDHHFFIDDLLSIESVKDLLACYPKVTKFKHLWGTVQDFYCWDNPSTVKPGMVIYLLERHSKFVCLEDSHRREFDTMCDDDHALHLSREDADLFSRKEFDSGKGGVLIVDPVLGHRLEAGRAIVFGTKK